MEQEDRYIRFDWAVKRLLRQKANFGVLEGFLTVLLGEKVKIIELLESESNQMAIDDKFNRVDIKHHLNVNFIHVNRHFLVLCRGPKRQTDQHHQNKSPPTT